MKKKTTKKQYLIEFRNGSCFESLEADNGVSQKNAKRFASKAEATKLMRKHDWIVFNGGMVIEYKEPKMA